MKNKIKIEYSSNNSGGSWWLTDQNWYDLERNGWKVDWRKDCQGNFDFTDEDGRFLGALATSASKYFRNIQAAIKEFEKITKQDVTDEGCNCCGAPHSFSWTDEEGHQWASGEMLLDYMFDTDVHKSKRQLLEEKL